MQTSRKNIKTNHGTIRDQQLEYDINREAAKILTLSSGKVDKYECITGDEILHPDQSRMIEQIEFTYSLLRKVLEKQTKVIADQEEKQIKAIEDRVKKQKQISDLFSNDFLYVETRYKLTKITQKEKEINRDHLIYKTGNKKKDKTYDFQSFKTISTFGRETDIGNLTLDEELQEQINLKN